MCSRRPVSRGTTRKIHIYCGHESTGPVYRRTARRVFDEILAAIIADKPAVFGLTFHRTGEVPVPDVRGDSILQSNRIGSKREAVMSKLKLCTLDEAPSLHIAAFETAARVKPKPHPNGEHGAAEGPPLLCQDPAPDIFDNFDYNMNSNDCHGGASCAIYRHCILQNGVFVTTHCSYVCHTSSSLPAYQHRSVYCVRLVLLVRTAQRLRMAASTIIHKWTPCSTIKRMNPVAPPKDKTVRGVHDEYDVTIPAKLFNTSLQIVSQ